MPNQYEGLSPKEADEVMIGRIGLLVNDAMNEARAMTQDEWDERDMGHLPYYFASAIYYAIENRRNGAP